MKTKGYLFSWQVWAFSGFCALLNLGLSLLCHLFKIPLFLNAIGTVLAGALVGGIPALIVALVSVLAFFPIDAMNCYYASLTILMGLLAFLYSRLGFLKKWWGLLLSYVSFVLIDGVFATLLVYFINGETFGGSIAAPYALWWVKQGVAPFWALFIADFFIGIADKAIVVPIMGLFLWFLPKYLVEKLPFGKIYSREKKFEPASVRKAAFFHSLKSKLVVVNLFIDVLIGLAFSSAFYLIYKDARFSDYEKDGAIYSQNVSNLVDGSQIDTYLASPENPDSSYEEAANKLSGIYYASGKQIASIYVYKIEASSQKVVFAIDPSSKVSIGGSLPFGDGLAPYEAALQAGEEISPFLSGDGLIYTVYTPIAYHGGTVAYAVVNTNMGKAVMDVNVALTKAIDITVIILLFGAAVADYATDNWIAGPLRVLDQQVAAYKEIGPNRWLDSPEWASHQEIRSGDELEDLDKHLCESEETISSSYAAIEIQTPVVVAPDELEHPLRCPLNRLGEVRGPSQQVAGCLQWID